MADGRTLIAKAPLDRTRRATNLIPQIHQLYRLRYVLCTSHIVTVVNLSLQSASGGNNDMTSLAAVSLYWSVRACKRVRDGLTHFRGVISGRSNSVRRSSASVTGFCATILNAVTALLDNVIHSISYKTYGSLIYVVSLVMQYNFSQNTLLVISKWLKWMICRHHYGILRLREVHIYDI